MYDSRSGVCTTVLCRRKMRACNVPEVYAIRLPGRTSVRIVFASCGLMILLRRLDVFAHAGYQHVHGGIAVRSRRRE